MSDKPGTWLQKLPIKDRAWLIWNQRKHLYHENRVEFLLNCGSFCGDYFSIGELDSITLEVMTTIERRMLKAYKRLSVDYIIEGKLSKADTIKYFSLVSWADENDISWDILEKYNMEEK